MRNILILLFCLHNFFSQSQDFEVINEDGNKRYQIGIDKLDYISKTYPDGWWEIHDSIDRDRVLYYVNIENNKIHGSFIDLTGNGKTIGNYYKDSLWTFLTTPEDSTFKMGTWRYTLSDILLPDEFYSIKYENDSLRSVIWNFYNGTIGREARYRKGFGLTDVIYYENKTNRIISKEEKNENYSIQTTYSGDSIRSITIVQDSIIIHLGIPNKSNYNNHYSIQYNNLANQNAILHLDTNLHTQLYVNTIDETIIRKPEKEKIEVEYGRKTVTLLKKKKKKSTKK